MIGFRSARLILARNGELVTRWRGGWRLAHGLGPAALLPRGLPIAGALALLVVGLSRGSVPSQSAGTVAIGFVLLVAAGVLHLLALRRPLQESLDSAAWVITITAVMVGFIFAVSGG